VLFGSVLYLAGLVIHSVVGRREPTNNR